MKRKQFYLKVAGGVMAIAVLATACQKNSANNSAAANDESTGSKKSLSTPLTFSGGTLVFQSSFDAAGTTPTTITNTTTQTPDISGNSGPGIASTSWTYNLEDHITPNSANRISTDFRLNYEGGTNTDRLVSLITDPSPFDGNDRALNFWVKNATIDAGYTYKGRVQAELRNLDASGNPGSTGVTSYYQEVSIYLPSADYSKLVASTKPGKFDWLSLMEFHDKKNGFQDHNGDFRMTIGLDKNSYTTKNSTTTPFNESVNPNLPLHFTTTADIFPDGASFQTNTWNYFNTSYTIPYDTWLETQLYIKEGDNNNGRFYFAIRTKGTTTWNVIFDITNYTRHPLNTSPTGQTDWSPMKLYSSADVINAFHPTSSPNTKEQISWDDLVIYKDRNPL